MGDLAIRTEHLSKQYRIEQGAKARYKTLRDVIAGGVSSTVQNIFNSNHADDNGLTDRADSIWALRDVNFEVRRGEVIGVIGHNGAGKSTLLKILTRITEPTRGTVDLWGRVGSLLEVGTGFHKELTGAENVYLNGAILGMTRAEIDHKFDEIVEFAEVEKFIHTPVKYYSSGMAVRLAFAVAAHLEPEILLVDEVLAVGDASFQRKCLAKMEEVGQEGRTVLFVSHHMPHITRLCERTVLLKDGTVLADGPTNEVVADYLTSALGTAAAVTYDNINAAPGNEVARLRSVRVKTESGETSYSFDIRKPVGLEMEFDVLTSGYVLYPFFAVNNETALWLFTSLDTGEEWRRKPRPAGRYVATAWIPGNLLTEGTMIIGAGCRTEEPFMSHFFEREAVAFQVIDPMQGDGARVDSHRRYHGVVRPYLEWQTEYIAMAVEKVNGS
ncbi:MAG TPA: polysaccharide ABC transporter ATP-binding protein [Anaerolineaceae bacterium]|nr:polysaccharide ABC transporter ATP-binding protein [Anaerolineaceae bacterium]